MRYATELAFASDLVYEMGETINDALTIGHPFQIKEADDSRVTEIDFLVNRRIIAAIKRAFPRDGILGEEESALADTDERLWIVDPVDGTRAFTCGIPTSTLLLALLDKGRPVLGLTYNPYVRQLFSATEGGGAFVHDRHGECQVEVDARQATLQDALIGVTGSATPLLQLPAVRKALDDAGARPLTLGSSGYEAALVGAGQFAGKLFGYSHRHDMAAAAVFVREAGGHATDLYGRPLDFAKPLRGAVLSNGKIHRDLLTLIAPYITQS